MRAKGIRHGKCKLTENDVRLIKKYRWELRMKYKDITKMFPVSQANIWRICNNLLWQHLEEKENE